MKRGIILLTPPEQQLLAQQLQASSKLSELVKKLQLSTSSSSRLQLSEEDAETSLDMLPMPSGSEHEMLTTLRKKLQAFLTQLRFPQ